MLAAVYYGPRDLRIEERPTPVPGPGEALVRVLAAGICGTDLRIVAGQHRRVPPGALRILGHEVVGDIAALGPGVAGFSVGERVFVGPNTGCGRCRLCQAGRSNLCADLEGLGVTCDGAFAEYMLVSARSVEQGNLMPVQPGVDPAVASLAEPLACVLHGQDACAIRPGDTVLVIGAGPIGIMHLLLARLSGAARALVAELSPARRKQALALGADRAIDPATEDLAQAVRAETAGAGADVILVAAPSGRAQQEALRAAAIGGRINFFGGLPKDHPTVELESNLVHYKELVVTGTTACSTADCRRALALINAGRLDLSGLVSDRFPLADAARALRVAAEGHGLKVVLLP